MIHRLLASKKLFQILIGFAILIITWGLIQILLLDFLTENDLHLSKIGVSQEPEIVKSHPIIFTDKSHTIFNYSNTIFTTYDVFSANNPVNYTANIFVRDEKRVDQILVLHVASTDILTEDLKPDVQNVESYYEISQKLSNNTIILTNDGTKLFSGSRSFYLDGEGDESLIAIILLKNDTKKLGYELGKIHIYPITEKHRVELNRISLAQAVAQTKNNHIMQGLSYFIVSWVFIQLALLQYNRLNKEKVNENISSNNSLR